MGLYDGYLYSKDGKIIPVDDTHHGFITKIQDIFFSPKEIEYLCNIYKVSSLKELSDTEEFQFEDGPIYNHFLKSVLKKGWLKIRNNQPSHTTFIVCYNYKRDYDTIMNFIKDYPELAENTLHIEAFGDDDYLTTEKRDVAKGLFKMIESGSGYLACCYDPDDYLQETFFVLKDTELSTNSSNAEIFETEEEAIDWAEDYRPYGWIPFAMKVNN